MDNKNLVENLVKGYNNAQRGLAPLFGLKPALETRIESIDSECVDLDHYYSGNYFTSDTLPRKEAEKQDPFILGYSVGLILYDIRNPQTKLEALKRTKMQVREFEQTGLTSTDSNPETPLMISKIVAYCCGYAHKNFRESAGENPLIESREAVEQFWQAMAVTNNPLPEALFGIFAMDHKSRLIAQELYSKFGYRIIGELALLPFLEAKERIVKKLGRNVFTGEETA